MAVDPLGFGNGQEGIFVAGCKPAEQENIVTSFGQRNRTDGLCQLWHSFHMAIGTVAVNYALSHMFEWSGVKC